VVGIGVASAESALEVPEVSYQDVVDDLAGTAKEAVQEAWSTLAAPLRSALTAEEVAPDASRGCSPLSVSETPATASVEPEAADSRASRSKAPTMSGCAGCFSCFRTQFWCSKQRKETARRVACPDSIASEDIFADDYIREVPTAENYEESRSSTFRHEEESDWSPTVMLYDASPDPPAKTGAERERLRRAYHMPVNSGRASRIENKNFSGSFLFLHREPDADLNPSGKKSSYEWHFTRKTRRWEARVQGKFRQKPVGTLYTGCVLEDFDYTEDQSWAARMLSAAVVPLMEAVVGERFYFAWGTRGPQAETEDAELGTIVTCLAGVDQVIVCPPGEEPAGLHTDISGLGLRRNAMSSREYHAAVQKVTDEIDTESTYTFCVWGCSRYIDVLRSAFVGIPFLGSMSYTGFIDEWPAHFVLYSLEDDPDDTRHLEQRKRLFIDVMVWSSNMNLPKLPSRYRFLDQK